MWRVTLHRLFTTRIPAALPRFRREKPSHEALQTALHNTIQEFLKPNSHLQPTEKQQACVSLLKEMKEMRLRNVEIAPMLQVFTRSEPSVKHWAEAYNTTRQMMVVAEEFFIEAERRLKDEFGKSVERDLMYEALQVYSGLGCAKLPLTSLQKQLMEVIDLKLTQTPERWSNKPSVFSLVLHTAAKTSYASERLRGMLYAGLPGVLRELETEGVFTSLGVVCSSASRLRLAKHQLQATIMPTVTRLQDKMQVKHLVNIVFYLSERSSYSREFFEKVMPKLEIAVQREGVRHFVEMLNATKSKLAAMEAQLPS